ncbi:hypothetical protein K438DRAFT_1769820 [Mycena galopus ATCC 62051]|nr:hypothetical protein K438DRAFT_1769820 [Mycena galopus ATCC 62051]
MGSTVGRREEFALIIHLWRIHGKRTERDGRELVEEPVWLRHQGGEFGTPVRRGRGWRTEQLYPSATHTIAILLSCVRGITRCCARGFAGSRLSSACASTLARAAPFIRTIPPTVSVIALPVQLLSRPVFPRPKTPAGGTGGESVSSRCKEAPAHVRRAAQIIRMRPSPRFAHRYPAPPREKSNIAEWRSVRQYGSMPFLRSKSRWWLLQSSKPRSGKREIRLEDEESREKGRGGWMNRGETKIKPPSRRGPSRMNIEVGLHMYTTSRIRTAESSEARRARTTTPRLRPSSPRARAPQRASAVRRPQTNDARARQKHSLARRRDPKRSTCAPSETRRKRGRDMYRTSDAADPKTARDAEHSSTRPVRVLWRACQSEGGSGVVRHVKPRRRRRILESPSRLLEECASRRDGGGLQLEARARLRRHREGRKVNRWGWYRFASSPALLQISESLGSRAQLMGGRVPPSPAKRRVTCSGDGMRGGES